MALRAASNKNLIPSDRAEDWDRPGGLRMGTIEVTRLGMGSAQMETIAEFVVKVLVERADPQAVGATVTDFHRLFQTLYYCFDHPLPPDDWSTSNEGDCH